MSVLRKEYEKRQGCTIKELIDIVLNDKSGLDLEEGDVRELIEKHYKEMENALSATIDSKYTVDDLVKLAFDKNIVIGDSLTD